MTQSSVYYEADHGDSLHEALDDVRLFRCKDCGNILYEAELSDHDCDKEDEPFPDA
jgi:rubrerythrin